MPDGATTDVVSLIDKGSLANMLHLADRTDGAIVEVGVYKGGSAYVLSLLERPTFLYDTFTGIPMKGEHDTHDVGDFADVTYEEVCALFAGKRHVRVVKGLFPDSIVPMPPIGFVHIDVDQEESARRAIGTLAPMMLKGGIMLFDDYMAANCAGLTNAVDEIFGGAVNRNSGTGKAFVVF